MAERIGERITIHDLVMKSEPWDGPGESPETTWGDQHGRAWKMLTLTTRALEDHEARFDPETLRSAVRTVRETFPDFWRRTPWGRQVRDPSTRNKRARRDTSAVTALEVAPGGMVHLHVLIYGEYVSQAVLAEEWGKAIDSNGAAVVDIRSVDAGDVPGGIREALKYATKGEGSRRDQARKAAAVEHALGNTKRVSILGALRMIQGRSEEADSEDVQAGDLHDDQNTPCEACGSLGRWSWGGCADAAAVARNGGWGLVRAPP